MHKKINVEGRASTFGVRVWNVGKRAVLKWCLYGLNRKRNFQKFRLPRRDLRTLRGKKHAYLKKSIAGRAMEFRVRVWNVGRKAVLKWHLNSLNRRKFQKSKISS